VSENHNSLLNSAKHSRAASYLPTVSTGWFDIPVLLTIFLTIELVFLLVEPSIISSPIYWIFIGISIPIASWLILRKFFLIVILRTPLKERHNLIDERWEEIHFSGWGGDKMIGHHLIAEEGNPNLLLYIHGYGSSMASGESRALHLVGQGMDIVTMDLRGHGNCNLRNNWTPLKVTADIEALLDAVLERYDCPPSNFWIYGHSVGGYIGLRLASYPSSWWTDKVSGLMLESPATSFPLIIEDQIPTILRPTMPWIRQVLRKEYERIHPDLTVRYATAQIPHMGLPKDTPILLLQASVDDRLGRKHYDLLMKYKDQIICEAYLLDRHTHTSRDDSSQRREHLEKWLKPRLSKHSERLL